MSKKVKAKITRVVTDIAIVRVDKYGQVDEYIETLEELECDDIQVVSIIDEL